MRNIIFIAIIAILVLVSASVLLVYYMQPFRAVFSFPTELSYASIEIQKSTGGYSAPGAPAEEMLQYAKAEIGTLALANQGMFTKLYILPELIGCIDLDENDTSLIAQNNRFSVQYELDGGALYSAQEISIPSQTNRTVRLVAWYQPYGIPMYKFSRENIRSVSLYEIPKKERNPIRVPSEPYRYNRKPYDNECASLKASTTPKSVIRII